MVRAYTGRAMPRPKRVTCRVCDRHIDEVGPLSARGKCEQCGLERVEEAVNAMFAGRGDLYERWAENTAAGLRRAIEHGPRSRRE